MIIKRKRNFAPDSIETKQTKSKQVKGI